VTERALRILVSGVVLSQPMGGVRRHNQELLPRAAGLLAARGGHMAVLVGREGLAFELPDLIERLPSDVPAGPPLARARLEGRALRDALAAAARDGRPFDLVHTAHLPAPRALGVPYTITLHDLRALALEHTPFSRRFVARSVIGAAVERAAAVITVSETVRAAIAQRFAPRATFVVPNAGDHLPVLPRAPGADAALLALGHVEPRKNLELVLRALALDRALPPLAIAGLAKGDEIERLGSLAEELGLSGRVRFLGAVPDAELPHLYAGCAAVVLPSRLEGFGIGVLEAQRARAPLAIADAGALPEVAGPGGPRFPPDDAAACARAIRAALQEDAATLAARAQRAERFTWAASADALVAAWTAAVSARP
jgi:glycosyltransferase involved in cell wall biosynthesis